MVTPTDPLTVAFFSTGGAILGSLITIFLTPRLQHHFWKNQRLTELRLAVIDELNRLMAKFESNYRFDEDYILTQDKDFVQSFSESTNKVRVFFPKEFEEDFKALEESMDATPERAYEIFNNKKIKILQTLYRKLGLL